MHWSQMESIQPRLAELGRRRLIRDPRILITNRDGAEEEFKVRGVARVEADPATQRRFAQAAAKDLGWNPELGRFHLFAVDITEVAVIRYNPENGDQHVTTWPPPRKFVRRATSATSVGQPEPTSDIVITD